MFFNERLVSGVGILRFLAILLRLAGLRLLHLLLLFGIFLQIGNLQKDYNIYPVIPVR